MGLTCVTFGLRFDLSVGTCDRSGLRSSASDSLEGALLKMMPDSDLSLDALERGLAELGLSVSPEQADKMLGYLQLIRKWNRAYNLVAPGDLGALLSRHLLDSLSIQPYIGTGPLLDAGTGAGLPGLPLAILNPGLEVVMVDSTGKKIRFLSHVSRTLKLENVEPVQERIEHFYPGREFSTITSRAFSSLREFATSVRHLTGPDTRLLAMKGKSPARELDDLPDWIAAEPVLRLEVPGVSAERHLVIMSLKP